MLDFPDGPESTAEAMTESVLDGKVAMSESSLNKLPSKVIKEAMAVETGSPYATTFGAFESR